MKTTTIAAGYGILQTKVMEIKGLSIQAKAVYAYLASMTGSKDYCFPKQETIAEAFGISRKTVNMYIKELVDKNLLIKSRMYNDMRQDLKYEVQYIQKCYTQCNASVTPNVTPVLHSVSNGGYTINSNSINNNREHISIKDTNTHECGDVDLFGERKAPKVKKEPDPIIDGVLQWFEKTYGFIPTDRKPRFVAFNLIRSVTSMYKRVKGTNVVDKAELGQVMVSFLKWYSKQKGYDNTQRLETVRSKLPVFEAEAKGLRK